MIRWGMLFGMVVLLMYGIWQKRALHAEIERKEDSLLMVRDRNAFIEPKLLGVMKLEAEADKWALKFTQCNQKGGMGWKR